MSGLVANLLVQWTMLAVGAQTYEDAYKNSEKTGRPILVLVGADWCPACQTLKHGALSNLDKTGELKNVAFAVVNADEQPTLANQLMRGQSIPQLVLYTKTTTGWQRTQLTGAQEESSVRGFISQGLETHVNEVRVAENVPLGD